MAEPIGYHEAVHAVRQRGDAEYLEFVENLGRYLDIGNQQMEGFLELISEGKAYQQKDFFDLSMEELDDLFDELNALVWGYHKVSPEHAREQFGGIFTDYEAYIEELDAIMERARQRNEVGHSGYRERPGISIERILGEGWRDEAPSVRGPEEDGVHNQERPQLLDSAENAGYDESTVWEGHRELDQDGNPVYAVTRREANIQPEDLRALQRKQRETAKRLGMSRNEASRLERSVKGLFSYEFNRRMDAGNLNEGEKVIARDIQSALEKFPEYNGRAYRNLKFDSKEEYDAFLAEYAEGLSVTLRAFTSTSKRPNGYPLFGGGVVHLVVDGYSGRDIADTYGLSRQQEVLYLPGTEMSVIRVTTANDGNPLIYLKEADDGKHRGENSEDFGDRGPA